MTQGTVVEYDAEEGEGYLDPDEGDERIPFGKESLDGYGPDVHPKPGDRVSYLVEGGLAGIYAVHVKRLEE